VIDDELPANGPDEPCDQMGHSSIQVTLTPMVTCSRPPGPSWRPSYKPEYSRPLVEMRPFLVKKAYASKRGEGAKLMRLFCLGGGCGGLQRPERAVSAVSLAVSPRGTGGGLIAALKKLASREALPQLARYTTRWIVSK